MRARNLALLPLLLSLAACTQAPPDAGATDAETEAVAPAPRAEATSDVVSPAAEGATTLAVGQVLEIALEGNASTGYAWEIAEDGTPQLAQQPVPADAVVDEAPETPRVVGAPGTSRWRFQAMQPGEARVRLVYRRAWEEGVEPAQEAVFDVVVADAR